MIHQQRPLPTTLRYWPQTVHALIALMLACAAPWTAWAAVPPPSIQDIAALLQSYRPDAERVARLRAEMQVPLVPGLESAQAAVALHHKANAAEELQEVDLRVQFLREALAFASQGPESSEGQVGDQRRIRSELAGALRPAEGVTASLDSLLAFAAELEGRTDQNLGWLVGLYRQIGQSYLQLGDLTRARLYLGRLEQALEQLGRRKGMALRMPNWLRQLESLRGEVLRAQGRLADAEAAYLAALRHGEESTRVLPQRQSRGIFASSAQRSEASLDDDQIRLSGVYLEQGRVDESELLLREVLKRALARDGRNSMLVGKTLGYLAKVMLNRGRSADAVELAQWADRTLVEAGLSALSPPRANGQVILANALVVNAQAAEAVQIIDRLRAQLKDDARLEEGFGRGTLQTIRAYTQVERLQDALADGDNLLRRQSQQMGAAHYETAEARAYRAMVLQRMGRVDEARREFELATQVLLDAGKLSGRQQTSQPRGQRLKLILGEYLSLLAGSKSGQQKDDLARAFMLADVARWQSVQKAVTGSALRFAAGSTELAARIKKVQDADDELLALYKNLISQRSAPAGKQLSTEVRELEQRIAAVQKEMQADLAIIRRQFPQYDALVNPRPADVQATRKALRNNEALLSVYLNPQGIYVWALGPDGRLRFHFSDKPTAWVAERVARLRASVDFSSAAALEKMPFDLQAASELYAELLAPVAPAWERAHTLLVVANDVLGQIPFSMLPTAPSVPQASAGQPPRWRDVPWLARKLAVAYVPSVSSLVTLRSLPEPRRDRAAFMGFGDPDFGARNSTVPAPPASRGLRSLGVVRQGTGEGSGVPVLPALPETREEIIAIAQALSAPVERDTFFGQQANPRAVAQADLRGRQVIAFATHGLVPGDLPGLDQPALALSPGAGQPLSRGLLLLEDILKLSLDADLVVLSACNTAAADGAGSEAVSGLGRGFFHAGARAVLATHWPVETDSARELVTRFFKRYASDPRLTRAQALRLAMLQLIDQESGEGGNAQPPTFYGHPAFWAPYALYGDPGR